LTHVGQPTRAKQDVPPAVRRLVLRRDGGKCVVPGCRHGRFVDIHHIEHRADGGDHHPDNLVTLCAAHHRATHRGLLLLVGSVASGLRFYHPDGTEYGDVHAGVSEVTTTPDAPNAAPSDLRRRRQMAQRALRRLGFTQRETDSALDQACAHVGPQATAEALLRRALEILTAELPHAS